MNNRNADTAESWRGLAILLGLNNTGRHIYAGTVPAAVVSQRRVKNRAARRARRVNRRSK